MMFSPLKIITTIARKIILSAVAIYSIRYTVDTGFATCRGSKTHTDSRALAVHSTSLRYFKGYKIIFNSIVLTFDYLALLVAMVISGRKMYCYYELHLRSGTSSPTLLSKGSFAQIAERNDLKSYLQVLTCLFSSKKWFPLHLSSFPSGYKHLLSDAKTDKHQTFHFQFQFSAFQGRLGLACFTNSTEKLSHDQTRQSLQRL